MMVSKLWLERLEESNNIKTFKYYKYTFIQFGYSVVFQCYVNY